jgi:hypothetical protein
VGQEDEGVGSLGCVGRAKTVHCGFVYYLGRKRFSNTGQTGSLRAK